MPVYQMYDHYMLYHLFRCHDRIFDAVLTHVGALPLLIFAKKIPIQMELWRGS